MKILLSKDSVRNVITNPKLIITSVPSSLKALTETIDQNLENVPKWKVLAVSAALTATSIYLYNYYLDIETGNEIKFNKNFHFKIIYS